jgi:hypothetical protein
MARTKHLHKRMNQRGISAVLVDLVCEYGMEDGDKLILDRKNTTYILEEIGRVTKRLERIRSKGGIAVVEASGAQITTYALDSYSATKKKSGGDHAIQ